MFVEQRLYTCAPGNTATFLKMYEQDGRAPQTRHQGQPIGYYVSEIGPLNQITTLWAYDSLDERVERRRGLFQDPAWIGYLEQKAVHTIMRRSPSDALAALRSR